MIRYKLQNSKSQENTKPREFYINLFLVELKFSGPKIVKITYWIRSQFYDSKSKIW